MNDLYLEAAFMQAEVLTKAYSTSFSSSLSLVDKRLRPAIYAVYAMARVVDEIVDTPHKGVDVRQELGGCRRQYNQAIAARYSSNPIMHAFQHVFHAYGLKIEHLDAFFVSMEMDLHQVHFSVEQYEQYIYGSAQAIGLMCLPIFCDGYPGLADALESGAGKLGSAYQKVNFLRDIASDYRERGRTYFPGITPGTLSKIQKQMIEDDIAKELVEADVALRKLPRQARRGVRLSYLYFDRLLKEISPLTPEQLFTSRISVPKGMKVWLYVRALVR